MNQRWAEVLCVLAAGSIARLRGDRMSICSNLQWIEFDGSQGCVNSWEFSMGVQHMEHVNGYETTYGEYSLRVQRAALR